MDTSKPIRFYDIASAPPATCYAPNPWKTRYALNFKNAPYQTEWVELPKVTTVRKHLGAAPNRTLPDGSPFYTLPVIENTATGEVIGDSFEIAMYLDRMYPNSPALLPPSSIGVYVAFNTYVDAIFTRHVMLNLHGIPMNPDTAAESRQTFAKRAGKERWEQLECEGDMRVQTLGSLRVELGELKKAYRFSGGPLLDGDGATYADLIVGAWLAFSKATLRTEEWDSLRSWHDGLWGKVHDSLAKYAEVK